MSLNEAANRITRGAMDFLFPRRCPFCGAETGRDLLCADCRRELPWTGAQAVTEEDFGLCAAPLYEQGKVRKALQDYRDRRHMEALDCFGSLLADCAAQEYMDRFDTVTWVPSGAQELRRGWDQRRLLAASFCVDWHTQPVETLQRKKTGRLTAVEENVRGRKLLLIDDVCRTGETLRRCTAALQAAGCAGVVCLTLARSGPGETGTGTKRNQT